MVKKWSSVIMKILTEREIRKMMRALEKQKILILKRPNNLMKNQYK